MDPQHRRRITHNMVCTVGFVGPDLITMVARGTKWITALAVLAVAGLHWSAF